MRHPYEKFIRLELIAVLLAILVGLFALFKGFILLVFITFYLIGCSIACAAIVEWYTHQTNQAGKHILQALLLIIFTTYMIFQL